MNILNIEDFKGRKALKEFFRDFIKCPKCMGLIHWKESPHLTGATLTEAISFPRFITDGGHVYYLNEKVMIDYARMNGIVK